MNFLIALTNENKVVTRLTDKFCLINEKLYSYVKSYTWRDYNTKQYVAKLNDGDDYFYVSNKFNLSKDVIPTSVASIVYIEITNVIV